MIIGIVVCWVIVLGLCLVVMFFFLMIRRPPISTRTDTLFPYTTLFRSVGAGGELAFHFHAPPAVAPLGHRRHVTAVALEGRLDDDAGDRKSTRLNSSH